MLRQPACTAPISTFVEPPPGITQIINAPDAERAYNVKGMISACVVRRAGTIT